MSIASQLEEAVKRGRGPFVRPGRYEVSVGAYGATVDVDITWTKKGRVQSFPHGTPSLSAMVEIDEWAHEEFDGDHYNDEALLGAIALKLGLKPRLLTWTEGAWSPSRRHRGSWTRSLSYRGSVSAMGD